jgi:hypothetical protein
LHRKLDAATVQRRSRNRRDTLIEQPDLGVGNATIEKSCVGPGVVLDAQRRRRCRRLCRPSLLAWGG